MQEFVEVLPEMKTEIFALVRGAVGIISHG
jgi:hypothetical protein